VTTDDPPPEATNRVSRVPVGFTIKATDFAPCLTAAAAADASGTAAADTGRPGMPFSFAATCAATGDGAATATGMRCGFGAWKAPT
jgi:hypothetical protein